MVQAWSLIKDSPSNCIKVTLSFCNPGLLQRFHCTYMFEIDMSVLHVHQHREGCCLYADYWWRGITDINERVPGRVGDLGDFSSRPDLKLYT